MALPSVRSGVMGLPLTLSVVDARIFFCVASSHVDAPAGAL